jgi:hypothetical protein
VLIRDDTGSALFHEKYRWKLRKLKGFTAGEWFKMEFYCGEICMRFQLVVVEEWCAVNIST